MDPPERRGARRGRRVATYGQPFYAGWGLTVDLAPPARRGRLLTLDELVAGVLLLFVVTLLINIVSITIVPEITRTNVK